MSEHIHKSHKHYCKKRKAELTSRKNKKKICQLSVDTGYVGLRTPKVEKYILVKMIMVLAIHLGYADEQGFAKRHLKPLLEKEKLVMTIPDKPKSKNQKYIAVKNSDKQ